MQVIISYKVMNTVSWCPGGAQGVVADSPLHLLIWKVLKLNLIM